jgi:hypothetical protein
MTIKELIKDEAAHLDFVWFLIEAKDGDIWKKEDLPKLEPFFKYSKGDRKRLMTPEESAAFDFYDKCSKEYANLRTEARNALGAFDIEQIAEFLGLEEIEMNCWDYDEDGNDIDEDGNIIPPTSRETIKVAKWFLEEYSYPLIIVGAIDSGWDRSGDFKMACIDFVCLSDFSA